MILKTSHSLAPSNDTSSCQQRPWPAQQKCLSLFLPLVPQWACWSEQSRVEPSAAQPFPMTHQRVSLFLNIFSVQSCVFILSKRGCCYGLHTTSVYGFFNQHQIMKSCLHLQAHPQKLNVCMPPKPHTYTHLSTSILVRTFIGIKYVVQPSLYPSPNQTNWPADPKPSSNPNFKTKSSPSNKPLKLWKPAKMSSLCINVLTLLVWWAFWYFGMKQIKGKIHARTKKHCSKNLKRKGLRCVYLGHAAGAWGDYALSLLYMMSPSLDYISYFAVTAGWSSP